MPHFTSELDGKNAGAPMKTIRRASRKTQLQIGAIPVRSALDGSLEILLVTTRTTRRWTVPKGWPIKGLKAHEAAAREAREEAGAVGRVSKKPVGRYLYWKRLCGSFLLCKVKLFILVVEARLDSWPEQHQRLHHWFKVKDAADLVDEPGLKAALLSLEGKKVKPKRD